VVVNVTATRLLEDRKARAAALRELRRVLAALREQAKTPPGIVMTPAASWEENPAPTPATDMAALVAAMQAGQAVVLPGAPATAHAGPTPALLQLVNRLVDILGLCDLEREFFTAGAARELPDAWDGLAAYADWLEERGFYAGAARLRKLTPADGDVLVFSLPRQPAGHVDGWRAAVTDALRGLESRGIGVTALVLPPDVRLDRLSEQHMADLGWVRVGQLAAVREACASLAAEGHYYGLADRIRAGRSPAELRDAEASPVEGGDP
jgi:hypothetical protein